MALNFKALAIGLGVLGVGLGVSFGAGVAYGRGDPQTVQTGLTQQQIQAMLGISGAGGGVGGAASGAGGASTTPGAGGGGQRGGGGGTGGGGTQQAAAGGITGQITAIQGQTVTVETRAGSQKVNLAAATTINKLTSGTVADLRTGLSIIVTGTRKDDGSYDATDVAQAPAGLQSLIAATPTGAR